MTLADFVEITRQIIADAQQKGEAFLPTFADPATRNLRVLDGAPVNDGGTAAREWAADMGATHYFLAHALGDGVSVEEFSNLRKAGSMNIALEVKDA